MPAATNHGHVHLEPDGSVHLSRYTGGWALGTGLPTAVPPGRHAVTGRQLLPGGLFLEIDRLTRIRLPLSATRAGTYAPSTCSG